MRCSDEPTQRCTRNPIVLLPVVFHVRHRRYLSRPRAERVLSPAGSAHEHRNRYTNDEETSLPTVVGGFDALSVNLTKEGNDT